MNGRHVFVAGVCVLLAGCFPMTCGEAPIVSQFGAYPRQPGYLQTAAGERFPVYRLKYWRFDDGGPPALQLEYEPPVSVADTAALRRYARVVWPALRPYLDAAAVRGAILTATNLERSRFGLVSTAKLHHFGILAREDSLGRWHLDGDSVPLPPADSGTAGIFRPNGARFPLVWVRQSAQETR